ncbi:hypothetical protein BIW11_03858 [Tropilaelaps mercedesae]|uniref:Uncharacterized protein n=1 Tax=Tropilaelaps mercedesae TaxID=418985 RepID=A0A1V9XFC2_9ACAR|nr:hypothetical protein BIW11_03858 [Tropilaelaps mercedesae]
MDQLVAPTTLTGRRIQRRALLGRSARTAPQWPHQGLLAPFTHTGGRQILAALLDPRGPTSPTINIAPARKTLD